MVGVARTNSVAQSIRFIVPRISTAVTISYSNLQLGNADVERVRSSCNCQTIEGNIHHLVDGGRKGGESAKVIGLIVAIGKREESFLNVVIGCGSCVVNKKI